VSDRPAPPDGRPGSAGAPNSPQPAAAFSAAGSGLTSPRPSWTSRSAQALRGKKGGPQSASTRYNGFL
jgi:hypothetical protein